MTKRDPYLAQIHIGKKELGLDDVAYRTVLERVTTMTSAKDLSVTQRKAVIAEFKRLGWKGGGHRNGSSKPYVRLIFGLWGELKRDGIWKEQSKQSLRAFVKRLTDRDDPEFLSYGEASKVIEALKAMKARANA